MVPILFYFIFKVELFLLQKLISQIQILNEEVKNKIEKIGKVEKISGTNEHFFSKISEFSFFFRYENYHFEPYP